MEEAEENEEKLVQLLVNHQAALHAFVLALLPGHPDANDVVQGGQRRALEKAGRIRDRNEFQGMDVLGGEVQGDGAVAG